MRASAPILAVAAAALLFAWLPAALAGPTGESDGAFTEPSSPVAREIKGLYDGMTIAALITGLGVQAFIIVTLWRYRAKPEDEGEAQAEDEVHEKAPKEEGEKSSTVLQPAHHGNTMVEVGYTIVTLVIFIIIAVVSMDSLNKIEHPNAPIDLQVDVTGHQWFWEFHYPGQNITDSGAIAEMHVPVNQVVGLSITSVDVLHAVWIPNLGVKIDAVPGHLNHFWFKAEKEGRFLLQCAEYCAGAHSNMHGVVVVESQATFDAWVVAKQLAARPPPPIPEVSGGQFNITLNAQGPEPAAINFVEGSNVSLLVTNNLGTASKLSFDGPYASANMAAIPPGGSDWLNISFSSRVERGNYTCTAGCAGGGVYNVTPAARIIDISLRQTPGTFGIWSIFPEQVTARPGEVIQFRVTNDADGSHNFSVLGAYNFHVHGSTGAAFLPHETVLSEKLVVGRESAPYICAVPSHDGLGMRGELKVEGAPPPTGGHGAPEETVPGFEGAFAGLALLGVASVAAAARRRQP